MGGEEGQGHLWLCVCTLVMCRHDVCVCVCVCAEVELWDEDDVRQWLEGIGMAEYIPTFIQRNIVGRELLRLRKSDLQVCLCVCVRARACVCVCVRAILKVHFSSEFLALQMFQDMGVTKVGHATRLYRALQALSSDTGVGIRPPRTTVATVHRMHH